MKVNESRRVPRAVLRSFLLLATCVAPAAPALAAPAEPDDRLPPEMRQLPPQPAAAPALTASPPSPRPRDGGFTVAPGERLSVALARFLRARGWSLEWNDARDYELQHGYELDLAAAGLPAAVARILAPYRLTAVLHDPQSQRVVAVGPARTGYELDDEGGQP